MPPELRFFEDFDSFKVESDYLEMVYHDKSFRFGYPPNSEDREFSINFLGKMQLTLPEMILQLEDIDHIWRGLHVVNFHGEFEQLLKYVQFVEQLTKVAGYQELKLVSSNSSGKLEVDPKEDEWENDEDDESEIYSKIEMQAIRTMEVSPRIIFYEDYTNLVVDQQHIDITVAGVAYRFAHAANFNQRKFTWSKGLPVAPKPFGGHLLIPGLTLLKQNATGNGNRHVHQVDLYMRFKDSTRLGNLTNALLAIAPGGYIDDSN